MSGKKKRLKGRSVTVVKKQRILQSQVENLRSTRKDKRSVTERIHVEEERNRDSNDGDTKVENLRSTREDKRSDTEIIHVEEERNRETNDGDKKVENLRSTREDKRSDTEIVHMEEERNRETNDDDKKVENMRSTRKDKRSVTERIHVDEERNRETNDRDKKVENTRSTLEDKRSDTERIHVEEERNRETNDGDKRVENMRSTRKDKISDTEMIHVDEECNRETDDGDKKVENMRSTREHKRSDTERIHVEEERNRETNDGDKKVENMRSTRKDKISDTEMIHVDEECNRETDDGDKKALNSTPLEEESECSPPKRPKLVEGNGIAARNDTVQSKCYDNIINNQHSTEVRTEVNDDIKDKLHVYRCTNDQDEINDNSVTENLGNETSEKKKSQKLKQNIHTCNNPNDDVELKDQNRETESDGHHELRGRSTQDTQCMYQTTISDDDSSSRQTLTPERRVINDDQSSNKFQFVIACDEWSRIKPSQITYGGKGITRRRLQGNWTDILSQNVGNYHPGCVLAFKAHRVKSIGSRKVSAAFLNASAYCKGQYCTAKFKFEIHEEPKPEECPTVLCTYEGLQCHTDAEVNRRNLTGSKRNAMAHDIRKSSAAIVFHKNLLEADRNEMHEGNFSSVPNPTVLRKLVSEQIHKEYLHNNIMCELQILKENDKKMNDPYIRDIGLDPFTLIMFADKQIKLIKELSSKNNLNLYVDATGTVIQNIRGQKKPFLYSIVVRPDPSLPPVSVADMISTQHTIPRIQLFFSTLQRECCTAGKMLKVKKTESDYSFALIQACLGSFNSMSLKQYIRLCYDSIQKKETPDVTIHHLCASHMIKDFIRKIKQLKSCNKSKKVKMLAISSFAALQNAISVPEAIEMYRDICYLFLSENTDEHTKHAEEHLDSRMDDIDEDDDLLLPEQILATDEEMHRKSIRDASPFTQIFNKITQEVQDQVDSTKPNEGSPNQFLWPEMVHCLREKYMPIIPLWSGLMLGMDTIDGKEVIISRDTNSPAENWFKFIKTDMTRRERERPSTFVIGLKAAVHGRYRHREFPGATKKTTTRKKKNETDSSLQCEEEIWKRGSSAKTQNVFHKSPGVRFVQRQRLPRVMRWGGRTGETHLSNTCTIDNALTMLHLFSTQHEAFMDYLGSYSNALSETLLDTFKLMSDGRFTDAKLRWIRYTKSESTNLFGDETDFFAIHFSLEWISKCVCTCRNSECPEPRMEMRETRGITIAMTDIFNNIQDLLDRWMEQEVPCTVRACCDSDQENQVACGSRRLSKRTIIQSSPVLVIRLYEHVVYGRITLEDLLKSEEVMVQNENFKLAGLTLYRRGHYCAIVSYEGCKYWYDGLAGELSQFPTDIDSWYPSHIVYCRV